MTNPTLTRRASSVDTLILSWQHLTPSLAAKGRNSFTASTSAAAEQRSLRILRCTKACPLDRHSARSAGIFFGNIIDEHTTWARIDCACRPELPRGYRHSRLKTQAKPFQACTIKCNIAELSALPNYQHYQTVSIVELEMLLCFARDRPVLASHAWLHIRRPDRSLLCCMRLKGLILRQNGYLHFAKIMPSLTE